MTLLEDVLAVSVALSFLIGIMVATKINTGHVFPWKHDTKEADG